MRGFRFEHISLDTERVRLAGYGENRTWLLMTEFEEGGYSHQVLSWITEQVEIQREEDFMPNTDMYLGVMLMVTILQEIRKTIGV